MFGSKVTNMTLFCLILFCMSCSNEPPIPKPKTYLRLDTPQPSYLQFSQKQVPFTFEYPDYGRIEWLKSNSAENKWFNIVFDKYGFEANVSYMPLKKKSDLAYMVNDCYTFLDRHKKFSSGIIEQEYSDKEADVYGTTFAIKGTDVVSPYQFYLTDSSKHFIRLALHCQSLPNNDSLSAFVKRIETDLNHMIGTLRWND